ncbi:hypothetical protein LTS72_19240 [Mycobacterium ostraviense]|nr:hypothetical protein [Mycobacterium ostraviense]UGT90441.1 hypothetical protein LTS72_19240 [Mycobacterium ostraviense]
MRARIIEPTSKADSLRALGEVGVEPVCYRTLTRRLPYFANPAFGQALSACAWRAGLGPAPPVLYDVGTPHFETDVFVGNKAENYHHAAGDQRRQGRLTNCPMSRWSPTPA